MTGGAGFIGSATSRALLQRGDDVVILDNLSTGFEENLPKNALSVKGDVRDLPSLTAAMKNVEVVIHLAAVRSVARSVEDPVLTHDVNVSGTLNVLIAAEQTGVRRVVYASSSSVYGGSDGAPSREDQFPRPASPYAASKLSGEIYCGAWTRLNGPPTVSLRYFNVFGPGQHPESRYAAVFPAFCSALIRGQPPEVQWDGEQARDFTYIDDVVQANLQAASAGPSADGEVVNIAGGRSITVNQVLEAISEATGVWIEPKRTLRRPGDVRFSRAEISRARALLEWSPSKPMDEAVAETVEWFSHRMG